MLRGFRRALPQPPTLNSLLPVSRASVSMGMRPHPENNAYLFHCDTLRWLYNEKAQLKERYQPFDVTRLKHLAAEVVGARHVVQMTKFSEGVFNKAFLLSMDNGAEVVLRIKNPIAGPSHFITASEVATMDFIRERTSLPVPKVLTWSSCAEQNDIGAEYILMEKVPGVPLTKYWKSNEVAGMSKRKFIDAFIHQMYGLYELEFGAFGSIYYKSDIPPPLRAPISPDTDVNDPSEKFCIGPIAARAFWEDERATMNIDRGPWTTAQDYLRAIGHREKAWIQQFATPRPGLHDHELRFLPGNEATNLSAHLNLIDQYLAVVPVITPQGSNCDKPTLWHPDLHTRNIYISDNNDPSPQILSYIDWQHAFVGPRYFQVSHPPFLQYGGEIPSGKKMSLRPEALDDKDLLEEERRELQADYNKQLSYKMWEVKMMWGNSGGSAPFPFVRRPLVATVGSTWQDGILAARYVLITLRHNWKVVAGADVPCPIPEEENEESTFFEPWEVYNEVLEVLESMQEDFQIDDLGLVSVEAFAKFRDFEETMKDKIRSSQHLSEVAKDVIIKWWPYRERES